VKGIIHPQTTVRLGKRLPNLPLVRIAHLINQAGTLPSQKALVCVSGQASTLGEDASIHVKQTLPSDSASPRLVTPLRNRGSNPRPAACRYFPQNTSTGRCSGCRYAGSGARDTRTCGAANAACTLSTVRG
jgi:hypothetical protein